MALVDERARLGREPIYALRLNLDFCDLQSGVAPCTSTRPVGQECYNTYQTCPVQGDFVNAPKQYILIEPQSGIIAANNIWPCIEKVDNSPTIINPEKGLGQRASVTVRVRDFVHHDIGVDPYAENRPYDTNQGTFFGKLLARNSDSYLNRPMELLVGYATDPWDWGNFQVLEYVITKIDGPDKDGLVKITGKDPLWKLNDKLLPEPSDGKLFQDIDENATSLLVTRGDYDVADPIVRINGEEIGFVAVVDQGNGTWALTGLERGARGTDIESHSAGDTVQQCIDYENQNAVDVLQNLLNRADVDNSKLNLTEFDFEKDFWLSASLVRNTLSEPKKAIEHISELLSQYMMYSWWDDRTAQVRLRSIAPRPANQQLEEINESSDLIADETDIEHDLDSQITRVFVAFDRSNFTESGKIKHYKVVEATIDATAESERFFNREKSKIVFADWISNPGDAFTLATRTISRFARGQRKLELSLDARNGGVWLGDLRSLRSWQLQDVTGAAKPVVIQMLRAKEDGHMIKYEAVTVDFNGLYGFYADDSAPDYANATEEQRQGIGFYSDDNGKIDAGQADGHRYI